MRLIKDEMWHQAVRKIRWMVVLGILVLVINAVSIGNNTVRLFVQKTNLILFAVTFAYLLSKFFFPSISFTDMLKKEMTLVDAIKFLGACILVGLFMFGVIAGFTQGL